MIRMDNRVLPLCTKACAQHVSCFSELIHATAHGNRIMNLLRLSRKASVQPNSLFQTLQMHR